MLWSCVFSDNSSTCETTLIPSNHDGFLIEMALTFSLFCFSSSCKASVKMINRNKERERGRDGDNWEWHGGKRFNELDQVDWNFWWQENAKRGANLSTKLREVCFRMLLLSTFEIREMEFDCWKVHAVWMLGKGSFLLGLTYETNTSYVHLERVGPAAGTLQNVFQDPPCLDRRIVLTGMVPK